MADGGGPADVWLDENGPAQEVSESLLLLVQGRRDAIVVPAHSRALHGPAAWASTSI